MPNPFAARTQIHYTVGASSHVHLVIYDVLGRKVAVLVNGQTEAGRHTATFESSGLPDGLYLYRLMTGQTVRTGRMTLAG